MKIVIDAMGGDNAPDEIVKGAALAKKELLASMILVGDEEVIRKSAEKQDISLSGITVCHAPDVITMEDSPLSIRDKSDSSMRIAFKMLKEGQADAFVGAGNTGAMHVGSTLFVHRIKGVDRSAIATIMPLERPTLLIDSGANVQVTPNFLYQFAVMGHHGERVVQDVQYPVQVSDYYQGRTRDELRCVVGHGIVVHSGRKALFADITSSQQINTHPSSRMHPRYLIIRH